MWKYKLLTTAGFVAALVGLSACQTPPTAFFSDDKACAFEGKFSTFQDEYAALPSGVDTFTADTPAIYFTTFVAAGCCEVAGVYWLYKGEVLEQQFVPKTDTENFISYAVFTLPSPAAGYPLGEYTVIVFQGGTESGRASFTVVEG